MKINRLEAHDRLLHFNKQADYISQGCRDCIANRPKQFENYPFYIFAHKREIGHDEKVAMYTKDFQMSLMHPGRYDRQFTSLDEIPHARLLWQPRLTKPFAQENSMLFKAYPPGDKIRVIWMIPDPRLWDTYEKGKLTQDKIACESIDAFKKDRKSLESKEDDDLPEWKINAIYEEISRQQKKGHNETIID